MLKKILTALAAIVVIFVIVVALQPADFRVERTTTIAAPQAELFAQVNDLGRLVSLGQARPRCEDNPSMVRNRARARS
jgi:hypothetical protein